jgi:hypothetical protein
MAIGPHSFHVPVMGTGFTIDTPLRVARFGISSVMSLVDDHLIERIRRHHARLRDLPFEAISSKEPDSRARRISAWLDLVNDLVLAQMTAIRALPFEAGNEKCRYFELLPQDGALAGRYRQMQAMAAGPERRALEAELTAAMVAGSIDCNIMTKLDRAAPATAGETPPGPEQSDAKAALRGFARSRLQASLVLSAGINPALFSYLAEFEDFFRHGDAPPKKAVILKVSDIRSALIQGKVLAKKGVEVKEFRIESGLNCGGHAFATDGELMGPIMGAFQAERGGFPALFEPLLAQAYAAKGLVFPESAQGRRILVTAQGGIGNHAEVLRLVDHYGADATGWATPFLLVPEVTAVDDDTRDQLARATEDDLWVSDVSPLGIAFNNLRTSSSETQKRAAVASGTPGSDCPSGYLRLNSEFDKPLCTASREYLGKKLSALGHASPPTWDEADAEVRALYEKSCICNQLGNGALVSLGIAKPGLAVSVCPGPNIAWFDRRYSLEEMVDNIYGRGESLVPAHRPHFFAKELELYVDHFEKLARAHRPGELKSMRQLESFRQNLLSGIEHYRALCGGKAYPGENLASLAGALDEQSRRLGRIWAGMQPSAAPGGTTYAAAAAATF